MGSYRRKVYKKKSMDLFHEKGLDCKIKDEVDFFYMNERETDGIMLFEEYPIMFNEPDIVKELKEEERSGKLQIFMIDSSDKKKQRSPLSKLDSLDINEGTEIEHKRIRINSYNDALALAKKVFKKISES